MSLNLPLILLFTLGFSEEMELREKKSKKL